MTHEFPCHSNIITKHRNWNFQFIHTPVNILYFPLFDSTQSVSPYHLLLRPSTPDRLRREHNLDQMRKSDGSPRYQPKLRDSPWQNWIIQVRQVMNPGLIPYPPSDNSHICQLRVHRPNSPMPLLKSGSSACHKYWSATSAQLSSLSQTLLTPIYSLSYALSYLT